MGQMILLGLLILVLAVASGKLAASSALGLVLVFVGARFALA